MAVAEWTQLTCFQNFTCLADACPDTCCAGWEIDLDEEILTVYGQEPGPLGDEIREKILREEENAYFACIDGRCPFLNAGGLCRLILARDGEQSLLSEVCREHPRFHEDYGFLRETSLAISCPAAAEALLGADPVAMDTRRVELPEAEETEELPWCFDLIRTTRDRMLAMAQDETLGTLRQRMAMILDLGWQLQAAVDNGLSAPEPTPVSRPLSEDLRPWLQAMDAMEFTDERLPDILKTLPQEAGILNMPEDKANVLYAKKAGNLLYYFIYRYVLRGVWDEDILGKVGFAIRATETILLLAEYLPMPQEQVLTEAAIRFSREVEHSDENLDRLYDQIWQELFPENE